jgi:hypothetical protein
MQVDGSLGQQINLQAASALGVESEAPARAARERRSIRIFFRMAMSSGAWVQPQNRLQGLPGQQ